MPTDVSPVTATRNRLNIPENWRHILFEHSYSGPVRSLRCRTLLEISWSYEMILQQNSEALQTLKFRLNGVQQSDLKINRMWGCHYDCMIVLRWTIAPTKSVPILFGSFFSVSIVFLWIRERFTYNTYQHQGSTLENTLRISGLVYQPKFYPHIAQIINKVLAILLANVLIVIYTVVIINRTIRRKTKISRTEGACAIMNQHKLRHYRLAQKPESTA